MDVAGIGTAITGAIDTVADKFFVDANEKQTFKLKALELQQQGEFKKVEQYLSAIMTEANSEDPWTSRARPSFLYVIYILILSAIPAGIVSAIFPEFMDQTIVGMENWLSAIPGELYSLFGIGYLGYTGAREYGKSKRLKNKGN